MREAGRQPGQRRDLLLGAAASRSRARFDFGWLDQVLDLLHGGGIAVDLATATASPPPWFSQRAPGESLPVTRDGVDAVARRAAGVLPVLAGLPRERALALAERARRALRRPPGARVWHVHNEYGCHNAHCYCDVSRRRVPGLAAAPLRRPRRAQRRLGHRVLEPALRRLGRRSSPPRAAADVHQPDPAARLPALLLRRAAGLLPAASATCSAASRPGVPVTTNFMAPASSALDYWAWAAEVDVVSNDHYLTPATPTGTSTWRWRADLTRGARRRRHRGCSWSTRPARSTGSRATSPSARASCAATAWQHVARGADGVLFFQWRASRAGAEKFHSGDAAARRDRHRGLARGRRARRRTLEALAEVRGSRVDADVAIALRLGRLVGRRAATRTRASTSTYAGPGRRPLHAALWRAGVTVDFVAPRGRPDRATGWSWSRPSTWCATRRPRACAAVVDGGGNALVDLLQRDRRRARPHPARRLPRARSASCSASGVEEFFPLLPHESVTLSDRYDRDRVDRAPADDDAQTVATYADGPLRRRARDHPERARRGQRVVPQHPPRRRRSRGVPGPGLRRQRRESGGAAPSWRRGHTAAPRCGRLLPVRRQPHGQLDVGPSGPAPTCSPGTTTPSRSKSRPARWSS